MKNQYQVLHGPCLTEKSDLLREEHGKITFKVAPDAGKIEIKQAIEKLFKVKVNTVRTVAVKGKKKRVGRVVGKRSDWKKAYVTLSEGSINFLDEL